MKIYTDKKQITSSTGKKWGYNHLVLLIQNSTGYKNLMKLVSIGYLEGFYYRPRVDKTLLKTYNEGLICTSGCLAGEINQFALQNDYDSAKKAALEYLKIFPDRFYLEIQNHNIDEELATHSIIKKLSKDLNIPLVATNDCHYALEEHWEAHDVLFCLGTDKNRDDPNRVRYEPKQFYIKSADDMYKLLRTLPKQLKIQYELQKVVIWKYQWVNTICLLFLFLKIMHLEEEMSIYVIYVWMDYNKDISILLLKLIND